MSNQKLEETKLLMGGEMLKDLIKKFANKVNSCVESLNLVFFRDKTRSKQC